MTTEGEERWWTLLRRAFGIPDIVSADNKQAAVAHGLLDDFPVPPDEATDFEKQRSNYDPDAVQKRLMVDADNVVATVAELGGRGELDELFYAGRPDKDALRKLVAGRTATLETEGLIDKAFQKIIDYVTHHRFED
jgi:hypothetical protein